MAVTKQVTQYTGIVRRNHVAKAKEGQLTDQEIYERRYATAEVIKNKAKRVGYGLQGLWDGLKS